MSLFSIWNLEYGLLLFECLIVFLMIMPYPSNSVRRVVVVLCEKLSSNTKARSLFQETEQTTKSEFLRTTQQVLLGITFLLVSFFSFPSFKKSLAFSSLLFSSLLFSSLLFSHSSSVQFLESCRALYYTEPEVVPLFSALLCFLTLLFPRVNPCKR